jgi:hypothetical protein
MFLLSLALGLALGASSCRRAPAPDRTAEKPAKSSGASLEGRDLILRKGLQIKIVQNAAGLQGKTRNIQIENPSGAEGLSFLWRVSGNQAGVAESQPTVPAAEAGEDFGKMTLANTVDGRRMTLPLFWPGGELFMSNSSAIWLSDRAFSELKKEGKTQWALGLLDNPLLGPAQGNELIETSLESVNRGLEGKAEQKAAAMELKVTDDSADYPLKLNGVEREVEVIEAGNWLAKLKILDNAQNPLILEVQVAPERSAANIFFPLSWIRPWLSYRVEEISIQP